MTGEDYTEDEWENSDDEDMMGPAAPGTRIFSLRPTGCPHTESETLDAGDNLPPPPAPDPTRSRPSRLSADTELDDERIRAAWTEAKEDLVNHLSGWAHKTVIKVQDHKGRESSKFTVKFGT